MRAFFRSLLALLLACAVSAGPAFAAREFPAEAQRARFSVVQYPVVKLNRTVLRMAPGAQVRDLSNQIIMAPSLAGTGRYHVLYTLDLNGDVFRVWLLSEDELAALKAQGR
jgi:hypothetical protein